jgi:hypothetical protein
VGDRVSDVGAGLVTVVSQTPLTPCHLNLLPNHEEFVTEYFRYGPTLLNYVNAAGPLLFLRYTLALLYV